MSIPEVGVMLACALIGGLILISQDAGKADPPAPASAPAALSETEARALAKYNEQVAKTPNTASAHWKLALWCEQNRLDAEAFVHFARVVELDPKRDAAWRKLGFKKQDGRWMTERQIAEEAELKKAEKTWAVELKQWHKEVHSGPRQAEALAALEKLTDPAAVPAIYREFGGGGPNDQRIAIRLLSQVDSPAASKALAVLAIYGKGPSVRQAAIDTLRNRNADDFLAFLVAMMKDPIEYQVKAVGGPGSPGVLLVEGQRFNLQRVYAPPAPNLPFRPGDVITYDNNGMPVVNHSTLISANLGTSGVPGSKTLAVQRQLNEVVTERYSFADAMNEAQKSAVVAQA
jgi:hypothetical protein